MPFKQLHCGQTFIMIAHYFWARHPRYVSFKQNGTLPTHTYYKVAIQIGLKE